MTGKHAWIVLVASIAAWEIHALRNNPDDLLSRALDDMRATHPVANAAILGAIAATSLHLARAIPPRMDIFTLARS